MCPQIVRAECVAGEVEARVVVERAAVVVVGAARHSS